MHCYYIIQFILHWLFTGSPGPKLILMGRFNQIAPLVKCAWSGFVVVIPGFTVPYWPDAVSAAFLWGKKHQYLDFALDFVWNLKTLKISFKYQLYWLNSYWNCAGIKVKWPDSTGRLSFQHCDPVSTRGSSKFHQSRKMWTSHEMTSWVPFAAQLLGNRS